MRYTIQLPDYTQYDEQHPLLDGYQVYGDEDNMSDNDDQDSMEPDNDEDDQPTPSAPDYSYDPTEDDAFIEHLLYRGHKQTEPQYAQFGAELLGGVASQVGGELINGFLNDILDPNAKVLPGVQQTLNGLQSQTNQQNQLLQQAKQNVRYGQQGLADFSKIKALKPINMGETSMLKTPTLSAAGSPAYQQDQGSKFGYVFSPDSVTKPFVEDTMKTGGNNVMGTSYQNGMQGVMSMNNQDPGSAKPTQLNIPTGGWVNKLFNGGGISPITQAVAGLASIQESKQIQAHEWEKLADQPYQHIRSAKLTTGTGQPAYARYGKYIFVKPS